MIKVPFKEGLFQETGGKWTLIGCKCKQCGQVFFPGRAVCPDCLSESLEPMNLSTRGILYSYTIVHMPGEHFPPPYAAGWIQLPEGIRIFSQLRGWQEQPLKTGIDMEMTVEKLWGEGEKEIMGYVFRPCGFVPGSKKG